LQIRSDSIYALQNTRSSGLAISGASLDGNILLSEENFQNYYCTGYCGFGSDLLVSKTPKNKASVEENCQQKSVKGSNNCEDLS